MRMLAASKLDSVKTELGLFICNAASDSGWNPTVVDILFRLFYSESRGSPGKPLGAKVLQARSATLVEVVVDADVYKEETRLYSPSKSKPERHPP